MILYFTSLIIGYRHSDLRLSNLKEIIKRFDKNCIEIIIVEQDINQKLKLDNKENLKQLFVYNPGPYNRSWSFNIGMNNTDRKYLVFSDADIFMSFENFMSAVAELDKFDVVSPYDTIYDLTAEQSERIKELEDYELQSFFLSKPRRSINLCGGMTMFTRNAIEKVNGWDENFVGWGGEDNVQTLKVERLGLTYNTCEFDAYHLYHEHIIRHEKYYKINKKRWKTLDMATHLIHNKASFEIPVEIGKMDKYEMKKNVTFMTRSMNRKLYDKMSILIDSEFRIVQVIKAKADNYFKYMFEGAETKWIVNIDEDCFINDFNQLLKLIEYMDSNEFDYCGMPDGGICPHRLHNPIVPNAFFNIFNAYLIKKELDWTKIWETKYEENMKYKNDNLSFKYTYDSFEPYYPLFFWLMKNNFKPLFLDVRNDEDGIATHLKFDGKEFATHSWYGRLYEKDVEQTKRIDSFFNEAILHALNN